MERSLREHGGRWKHEPAWTYWLPTAAEQTKPSQNVGVLPKEEGLGHVASCMPPKKKTKRGRDLGTHTVLLSDHLSFRILLKSFHTNLLQRTRKPDLFSF